MYSLLESCTPRPEILRGTFNPEVFTASLSQVMEHYRSRGSSLDNIYTDAATFFTQATFPTQGMRAVVSEVIARLSGESSVPAIQRLETAFGGGKTHTLIALTHIGYRGRDIAVEAASMFLPDIASPDSLHAPGEVQVVGVAGDEIPVHEPQGTALVPYTLWGEIAFQIGGEALYRAVESEASSPAAPGKDYLERVLGGRRVMIMLDELAQYSARLSAARSQGADQLAAFLMSLNGYARSHSGIALVLTLAGHQDAFASQTERLAKLITEVRGEDTSAEDAVNLAAAAEKGVRGVVARDATVVVPVQAGEISRVLAQRLFERIDQTAAAATADAYMDMYARSAATLPQRAGTEDYRKTLAEHYPFHPTFIEFLNHKLATLENFQGTRGVLRVLALAVRNIWDRKAQLPMIHTGHLDTRDARIVNEVLGRGGASDLLPALNTDIGGVDTGTLAAGESRAQQADRRNAHPAGYPMHEYTWKTVFLHSLVGRGEGLSSNLFGITQQEALFEIAFPGMTPPQVETALAEIESSAYYLRFSRDYGRYYASLDASVNRALGEIRAGLPDEQIREHLIVAARRIAKDDAVFKVAHDVSEPEHVPDKTNRPVLAIIEHDLDELDAEAFVTTVGPNRPRTQQNLVFLLMPKTVHVETEIWSKNRASRAGEAKERVTGLAREVLARRRLRDQPESFGITANQLNEEDFEPRTRERELALLTAVSELYDGLYFPGSSGQVVHKEIHAPVGGILDQVRAVLDQEGELVTAARVQTSEALVGLGKLMFQSRDTAKISTLRAQFREQRRWPVLESDAVFDQLIRSGVERGHWCLFRMASQESPRPETLFGRDDTLPFDLDLNQEGMSIVTVQGANQRGWGGAEEIVDPSKVDAWVEEVIAEESASYVVDVIRKIEEQHGKVPEQAVLNALDNRIREDRLATFSGSPDQESAPSSILHGRNAILHKVQKNDVVIAPSEASTRGWLTAESRRFQLQGPEAADRVLPLLKRLGGFYARGANTQVDVLDLVQLQLEGGGFLRMTLQNASPESMKRLAELFEVLSDVASKGPQTQAMIRVDEPDDACPFLQALKGRGGA